MSKVCPRPAVRARNVALVLDDDELLDADEARSLAAVLLEAAGELKSL